MVVCAIKRESLRELLERGGYVACESLIYVIEGMNASL